MSFDSSSSSISGISEDDSVYFNPDNSIFRNPKCKYTMKQFKDEVESGLITPFYPPSECKTFLNDIMCEICYSYYPRINQTNCCHRLICSRCFLLYNICPICKKKTVLKANCTSDQINENDDISNQNQYPRDTLKIAEEFGEDIEKVEELLKSGLVIEDIFNEDYC